MTYRVINLTTGEIVAELADLDLAKEFADKLAAGEDYASTWAVVELVTRHETARAK